jgi:hypothetical protein
MNLKEEIQRILRNWLGCEEVTVRYEFSTQGNAIDARLRSAFFGGQATFWMHMAIEADSPDGEAHAIEDAKLAYQYAKIAYNLENERFAYLAESEPVLTPTQGDTPGQV